MWVDETKEKKKNYRNCFSFIQILLVIVITVCTQTLLRAPVNIYIFLSQLVLCNIFPANNAETTASAKKKTIDTFVSFSRLVFFASFASVFFVLLAMFSCEEKLKNPRATGSGMQIQIGTVPRHLIYTNNEDLTLTHMYMCE